MKKLFVFFMAALFCASVFSVTFTDDLGRTVTVSNPQHVAVLQGSLATVWLLAGGTIESTTSDSFSEPEALTAQEAAALNKQWNTSSFYQHEAGVFGTLAGDESLVKSNSSEKAVLSLDSLNARNIQNVGAMMSPNAEQLVALKTDFVIMSANISGHKKLEQLFENANIPCAYFDVETFASYMNMISICAKITGNAVAYEKNSASVQKKVQAVIAAAKTKFANVAAGKRTGDVSPKVLLLRAFSAGASAKNSKNNMVGDMLASLGTINIADSDVSLNENLSMEKIITDDPDFIFVTTMGASEEKAIAGFNKQLALSPAWSSLTAVKQNRCIVLPRELYHFKPGCRWAACYSILSNIVY
jgi:iron complex transport system substrate-binding protein